MVSAGLVTRPARRVRRQLDVLIARRLLAPSWPRPRSPSHLKRIEDAGFAAGLALDPVTGEPSGPPEAIAAWRAGYALGRHLALVW